MNYLLIILCICLGHASIAQAPLSPTEDEALLLVTVSDMKFNPRPHDKIIFEGKHSQNNFEGIADQNGKFSILLPEGDIYLIKIQGLGSEINFDELKIPKQEGKISGEIAVRYRPAQKFNLNDVHFETGKSTLLSSSFPTLDKLVEVLQLKQDMAVEIAGHTDAIGDDDSNLELSQNRAQAVVNYLNKKGIKKDRLIPKGYGETQPIANNETIEGRKENRRTEARIL